MKELLSFAPTFTPGISGEGTLDFSRYPSFEQRKLYAVINTTRNTFLYIPGANGYSASTTDSPFILSLQVDTSTHDTKDKLNVVYDMSPGYESNTPLENGGQLQLIQETLNSILVELKLHSLILVELHSVDSTRGFNLDDIRNYLEDAANSTN